MIKILGRTTPYCDFCERAKMLLNQKGIAYTFEELNVDDVSMLLQKFPNLKRTVPMIFEVTELGEQYIGGYTELQQKLQLQEQASMLTEVTNFEL